MQIPEKHYHINTSLPNISVEVPESTFNLYLEDITNRFGYSIVDHKECWDENGNFHYITCYDVYDCYNECLGTACVIHEVNA